MFKKFLLLLFLFLTSITLISAAGQNDSYDEIKLEINGFCPGFDIPFKIYNDTEYPIRKEIKNNLCGEGETPEDDGCQEFNLVEADYIVNNGPIDSLPILFEGSTDSNGEFELNFPQSNDYFIKIVPKGNYNDLETRISIIECKSSTPSVSSSSSETSDTNSNSETALQNLSLEFDSSQYKLNITNANFSKENISIVTIKNFSTKILPNIENKKYKTFEISGTSTFEIIQLETTTTDEDVKLNILKFNNRTNSWDTYLENVEKSASEITMNITEFGIYSIVDSETKNTQIVKINQSSETPQIQSNQDSNTEPKTVVVEEKTPFKIDFQIIIVILLAGALILGIIFMPKNSDKIFDFSNYRNPVINAEEYKRIKQYVNKYKQNYNKEQIAKALENANISPDVIKKVLVEEFPQKKQ